MGADLETEKADLETEKADLETQVTNLTQEKTDLEEDKSDLETQVTQKQSQIDELEEQIHQLTLCTYPNVTNGVFDNTGWVDVRNLTVLDTSKITCFEDYRPSTNVNSTAACVCLSDLLPCNELSEYCEEIDDANTDSGAS